MNLVLYCFKESIFISSLFSQVFYVNLISQKKIENNEGIFELQKCRPREVYVPYIKEIKTFYKRGYEDLGRIWQKSTEEL